MAIILKQLLTEAKEREILPPLPSNLKPLPKTVGMPVGTRKVTPNVEDLFSRLGYKWSSEDKGYVDASGMVVVQVRNDGSSVAFPKENPEDKVIFTNLGKLLMALTNQRKSSKRGKPLKVKSPAQLKAPEPEKAPEGEPEGETGASKFKIKSPMKLGARLKKENYKALYEFLYT